MKKIEFHELENQLWLEEWLQYKSRDDKNFIASLNEHKAGIKHLNLSWQNLKGKWLKIS